MSKLLVTVTSPGELDRVRAAGCEVLATYPDSVLVQATDAQEDELRGAGLELAGIPAPTVRVGGASFSMDAALRADAAAPIVSHPGRTAYYLVQLAGPPHPDWMEAINAAGGAVHGTSPGFSLLVGMLPAAADELAGRAWVEAITPYRPAMKVSPKLRRGVGGGGGARTLSAGELEAVALDSDDPAARQQVEISMFPGESTADVTARVLAAGGTVLTAGDRTVKAVVAPRTIGELAHEPGVQAILPDAFPELHNDRATLVMGAPADRRFGTARAPAQRWQPLVLRGTGQVVAIADTGLDTGDPAAIHADVSGRLVDIVSWHNRLADWCNDPPPFDDGPADTNSGHGTHVAGSVLGNGAAASEAGSATVPVGMAPEAECYLQAIEQHVTWKSADELRAIGVEPPPNWPPPAAGLYGIPDDLGDLFGAAYAAGARIHTNSWGASVAGVYNANAGAVDQFMWEHRDMLVLFSAGNSGVDEDSDGLIDPDSIGAPGTAKNCLTVGASENDRPRGSDPAPGRDFDWSEYPGSGPPRWPALAAAGHLSDDPEGMAAFSSRGPTDDGRIKPEVVAPGVNVLSVRTSVWTELPPPPPPRLPGPLWGDLPEDHPLHGLYCWSGGTSMSTPLVAGAAALVRQYLVDHRDHSEPGVKPSGALLKAILCNGADTLAGQFSGEVPTGANNVAGFGRVNVAGSVLPHNRRIEFLDEPDQAVGTGEMRVFEAEVADASEPLKVTLAWTDAPAPVGLGGLVNRLYLQVRGADFSRFVGPLGPGGSLTDGDVTPFPTVTNNVQQVVIAAPEAGTYEIRVRGVAVIVHSPPVPPGPTPRQDFALAASNVTEVTLREDASASAADAAR